MKRAVNSRLLREESGFTLVEVVVTMTLMVVVLFALYGIFDMGLRTYNFGNDKVEAVENARLGMENMERELRAAYPVDPINGETHVFFEPGAASTPAEPGDDSITFGNDISSAGVSPNRMVDPEEEITYELRNSEALDVSCPSPPAPDTSCTLVRRLGVDADFEPVVQHVAPGGLTFTGYRSRQALSGDGLQPADSPDGTDIGLVRVELTVKRNQGTQELVTDVDLRNRG